MIATLSDEIDEISERNQQKGERMKHSSGLDVIPELSNKIDVKRGYEIPIPAPDSISEWGGVRIDNIGFQLIFSSIWN